MKYLVKFTFWSDEKDIRILTAYNCRQLQGMLVGINENKDIELLGVEILDNK